MVCNVDTQRTVLQVQSHVTVDDDPYDALQIAFSGIQAQLLREGFSDLYVAF